jgi:hypothetical protein
VEEERRDVELEPELGVSRELKNPREIVFLSEVNSLGWGVVGCREEAWMGGLGLS